MGEQERPSDFGRYSWLASITEATKKLRTSPRKTTGAFEDHWYHPGKHLILLQLLNQRSHLIAKVRVMDRDIMSRIERRDERITRETRQHHKDTTSSPNLMYGGYPNGGRGTGQDNGI